MSTLALKRNDTVLLIERRGDVQVVHNALVAGISMDESLAGSRGENAIEVAFIATESERPSPVLVVADVVHITHPDWIEGRAGLAYEELPFPLVGVCRYCRCTERRACGRGCAWADADSTVCDTQACVEKYYEENSAEVPDEVFGL